MPGLVINTGQSLVLMYKRTPPPVLPIRSELNMLYPGRVYSAKKSRCSVLIHVSQTPIMSNSSANANASRSENLFRRLRAFTKQTVVWCWLGLVELVVSFIEFVIWLLWWFALLWLVMPFTLLVRRITLFSLTLLWLPVLPVARFLSRMNVLLR